MEPMDGASVATQATERVSDDSQAKFQTFITAIARKWEDESRERKQERSKRREQEIMRAAMRVFARDGISRARIGDIASEAGMPVSSIYDYFPSKEILAYALPMEQLARFYSEFAAAVAAKTTYRDRIRLYLWMAGDFARRNPEWARILYLEIWPSVLVSQSDVRHGIDDYARVLVHMVRAGEAAGEWSPAGDPYDSASILNGAVNQTIITWLLYRHPRNLMKNLAAVIDRVLVILPPCADDAVIAPAAKPAKTRARRKAV